MEENIDWDATSFWLHHNPFDLPTSEILSQSLSYRIASKPVHFLYPLQMVFNVIIPTVYHLGLCTAHQPALLKMMDQHATILCYLIKKHSTAAMVDSDKPHYINTSYFYNMSSQELLENSRDDNVNINSQEKKRENLFQNIGQIVDNGDAKPTEIESYCVHCGENGITKLLLTKIPHWRDIVIMSFDCEHCGFSNNEVQFAGAISEKGSVYTCTINDKQDLDRQLVKSETASIKIKEIDLEIPATTKRGCLTTIEGIISSIVEDLSADQLVRKEMDEVNYEKIEVIIQKLKRYLENKESFTIIVDDPAGNSYIESLCVSTPDPKLHVNHYVRTCDMDISLGLNIPDDQQDGAETTNVTYNNDDLNRNDSDSDVPEVMTFPANCSHCNATSETKMHILDIPHFKEVIIMATNCDVCGYKSNEVKSGGCISPLGKKITLKIEDLEDMSRDILKSETCGLSIPEIELEVTPGTLGGRFTTVEGLLKQIHDELEEKVPFISGDSVNNERKVVFQKFMDKLNSVISGEVLPVTLILDDPLANSYLQNPYAPDPDPNMATEHYERTWEQNEFLGLNDIVLENYDESKNENNENNESNSNSHNEIK
ncbi:hypothetical protein RclHR1_08130008 [Rhizophagus clarus]|uniref:Zinc finger ZPR1-type domain-containing protein n=1 Tax=Rhizophagus clarus TaxID=94130 RepID=A0A2Z6SB51_9GLOM|nr:hypothetical protein RclHR1_08130008 [Rhizophagus clarus]